MRVADLPPERWEVIRRFEEDFRDLRWQVRRYRLVIDGLFIPLLWLAVVAHIFFPDWKLPEIVLLAGALEAVVIRRWWWKDLSCPHCGSRLELPRRDFPPLRFCLYCGNPLSMTATDPPPIPPQVLYRRLRGFRIQKAVALIVTLLGAILTLTGMVFQKIQKNDDPLTAMFLVLLGLGVLVPGLWFFFRRRCPTCGEWISTVVRDPAKYCYRCGAPLRPPLGGFLFPDH